MAQEWSRAAPDDRHREDEDAFIAQLVALVLDVDRTVPQAAEDRPA
jgi:hypothetical protein